MSQIEPEAEEASIWAASSEIVSMERKPATVMDAALLGARLGLRWSSYLALPFELLVIAAIIGSLIMELAIEGRVSVHGLLPKLLMLCFSIQFIGTLSGIFIATLLHLLRRLGVWSSTRRSNALSDGRGANLEAVPRSHLSDDGRWLSRWVIASVCLVGVGVILVLSVGFSLKRSVDQKLAKAMAAASRDDPHWRLDDLLAHRIPVPDEENSALVAAKVLDDFPDGWPASPPANPGEETLASPVKSAFEAADQLPDNERISEDAEKILRDDLDQHQKAVALARTIANFRRGRHDLEIGSRVFDTRLPETQNARSVARLLSADAKLLAQEGKLDEALDSCRAVLGVGRSIGDEPFLISQLVRVAYGSAALKTTRRVLAQGVASDEALARVQSLLLEEIDEPLTLWAFRGERATYDEVIRRIADGELPISALSSDSDSGQSSSANGMSAWGRIWFDHQRAVIIEWMNELLAIYQRPTPEWQAATQMFQEKVDAIRASKVQTYASMLPLLLAPAINSAQGAFGRYQSDLRSTLVLIAAERHRIKHGDWPESIDAIDPLILPKAPLDFYSGRPLLLERPSGQFLVHSVGPNLKDEHGELNLRKWGRNASEDDIGATGWDISLRGVPAKSRQEDEDIEE